MAQSIDNRPIPGITARIAIVVILAVASVVSSFFVGINKINARFDNVEGRVEKIDDKVSDVLLRDSLQMQIMQLQINQLREDVQLNREILRDIRDTQILK